jgi:hypothetical protein
MAPLPSFSGAHEGNNDKYTEDESSTLRAAPNDLPMFRVYPRLHLLGLPQEFRDIVYIRTFTIGTYFGACELRPLLACRQLYYEANELAWAAAGFDLSKLSENQLKSLDQRIPPQVSLRNIFSLSIPAKHLHLISQHRFILPTMSTLDLSDRGVAMQCRQETMEDGWRDVFWHAALFHGLATLVYAPPIAFTGMARYHIAMDEIHELPTFFATGCVMKPIIKVSHVYKIGHGDELGLEPEHYHVKILNPATKEQLAENKIYCMDTSECIEKIGKNRKAYFDVMGGERLGSDHGCYFKRLLES